MFAKGAQAGKKPDRGNGAGYRRLFPHAPADHCAVARGALDQDQIRAEARSGFRTFHDAGIDRHRRSCVKLGPDLCKNTQTCLDCPACLGGVKP